MPARSFAPAVLAVLLTLVAGSASAAVLPVQGALRTAAGGPAADGKYVAFVRLYAAADAQEPLWEDVVAGVDVQAGLFALSLGGGKKPLPDALFDGAPRWLGIQIGADPELPRVQLGQVPYAVHAQVAATVQCSACIQGGMLAPSAITADKVAFAYAAAGSKGGAALQAEKALALECTGCVSGPMLAPASVSADKIQGGKGSGLDADLLDGQSSEAFVLKTELAKAGYSLNDEQNVDAGAPVQFFVRNVGAQPVKKALLDVWALAYLQAGGQQVEVGDTGDGDFGQGTLQGVAVSGQGPAAAVVLPAQLGSGADGALVVAGTVTINTVRTAVVSGKQGEATVEVASEAGLQAGQAVVVAQMTGANAGAWHETTIGALQGKTVTLAAPLPATVQSSGATRAQLVVLPQYKSVVVPAGTTLTAPPWDGQTGGILAFWCQGLVDVQGAVTMQARGFRGTSHQGQNYKQHTGVQGEGSAGTAVGESTAANGSGGGGGQGTQDAAGGGGGGHGTAGSKGPDCGGHVGGAAGGAVGNDTLATAFLGGAGGEGGSDEDGSWPGKGGHGGGIVHVRATEVVVAGTVSADGEAGSAGCQNCFGSGSGMGGGGGGAGGAVRLVAGTVGGDGKITAVGGAGAPTCSNCCTGGGDGGAGRVLVAGVLTGTTTPAAKTATAALFAKSGVFTSRLFKAGLGNATLTGLAWTATTPDGTGLQVEVRASPQPFAADAAKPVWTPVAQSGAVLSLPGQHAQYRVTLTGGGAASPALDAVTLAFAGGTGLGSLPSALTLAVEGQAVALNTADPLKNGTHVLEQLDVTAAFNAATAADPVALFELGSATPGRYQWFLWIER